MSCWWLKKLVIKKLLFAHCMMRSVKRIQRLATARIGVIRLLAPCWFTALSRACAYLIGANRGNRKQRVAQAVA